MCLIWMIVMITHSRESAQIARTYLNDAWKTEYKYRELTASLSVLHVQRVKSLKLNLQLYFNLIVNKINFETEAKTKNTRYGSFHFYTDIKAIEMLTNFCDYFQMKIAILVVAIIAITSTSAQICGNIESCLGFYGGPPCGRYFSRGECISEFIGGAEQYKSGRVWAVPGQDNGNYLCYGYAELNCTGTSFGIDKTARNYPFTMMSFRCPASSCE